MAKRTPRPTPPKIEGLDVPPSEPKRRGRPPGSGKKVTNGDAVAKNTPPAPTGPKKRIEQYQHTDKKRANNPPVGLVTPDSDRDSEKKTYEYDPHLDPQLVWAGKKEHTSFEVPTVSLHVHERIDPRTIIETVRKKQETIETDQMSLFGQPAENPPLREAIEFYKHPHNWSNRLIAGDSLLVMNSLLEKEGMAGQVQMIFLDPPYGIRYASNFQPFVNKRDVKEGKDEDLTQEPEMIKAFRDTWELGVHSYLTYLRDRLLLSRDLLGASGSLFVQISDTNLHHVRELLDEVFGEDNFVAIINFQTMTPLESGRIESVFDYLVWYARDKKQMKYRNLYIQKPLSGNAEFRFIETEVGDHRELTREELANMSAVDTSRVFKRSAPESSGFTPSCTFPFEFGDRQFSPRGGKSWRTNLSGMTTLRERGRLFVLGTKLYYKLFYGDFPYSSLLNSWSDTVAGYSETKRYVVQTHPKVLQRCMLMTTDPGDLVLDPTCGSGTTAFVAEQWGRRWITCDTSRVAVALTRQRLMTATFDYFQLVQPSEGVGSGFRYRTVPHVTLKSVANNLTPTQETLYDQPYVDSNRTRVSGPLTVEAVPAPTVRALHEAQLTHDVTEKESGGLVDTSVGRSGETLRQSEWRDELLKTGIRGKGGQVMRFSRVEPLAGTRWLHADAETIGDSNNPPKRVVVSFGPEHAPLEQRQVDLALEEAEKLRPAPKMIVFAAFEFDPEAAKDIEETKWEGMELQKVKMNADLLTEDLKKKRSSNESFFFIGQPEVQLTRIEDGEHKGKWTVEVLGWDYFDVRKGVVESGDEKNIAMWMLDTDYDGRSMFARQVFFPMAGEKDGWARLAKNLKAEIDEELIEQYRGTVSLPFERGRNRRAAVKIVDDRGIESVKVLDLEF